MSIVLLLLQFLFAFPVTSAYAVQVKKDVVVSVTYTTETPVDVCTYAYEIADTNMVNPTNRHCWKPKNNIGDTDTWVGERLDMTNFKVSVKYPSGKLDEVFLTLKINT